MKKSHTVYIAQASLCTAGTYLLTSSLCRPLRTLAGAYSSLLRVYTFSFYPSLSPIINHSLHLSLGFPFPLSSALLHTRSPTHRTSKQPSIKTTAVWDVTPCSLVDRYQRLGEICCLIFRVEDSQGWWKLYGRRGREQQAWSIGRTNSSKGKSIKQIGSFLRAKQGGQTQSGKSRETEERKVKLNWARK